MRRSNAEALCATGILLALPLGCGLLAPLDPLPRSGIRGEGASGGEGDSRGATGGAASAGAGRGGAATTGGHDTGTGGSEVGGISAGGAGGAAASGGEAGSGADAGSDGEGGTNPTCRAGDIAGCRCPDDLLSYRPCADGVFGTCVCSGSGGEAGAGTNPCVPEEEWCDGLDNDCNDVADDHFACPDDSVANTAPFSGGIYRTGETPSFPCGSHALQQFWPERAPNFRTGFGCHVVWYRFRRRDGALYYHDLIDGLFRDSANSATADDVPVAMACNTELPIQPAAWFDFDGNGTLHYQCGAQLLRGDGEVVAGSIIEPAGVLDDGRVIVTRALGSVSKFVVLSPEGAELNALPPPGFFTGEIWPMPFATTVRGNTAYVVLERVYGQVLREAVVYEVDEDSNFRLVRRAAISVRMGNYGFEDSISLVISDGTVFVVGDDPMPSGPPRSLLNVYLPDNTTRVFHQDAEPTAGRVFGFGLVPGPRE